MVKLSYSEADQKQGLGMGSEHAGQLWLPCSTRTWEGSDSDRVRTYCSDEQLSHNTALDHKISSYAQAFYILNSDAFIRTPLLCC